MTSAPRYLIAMTDDISPPSDPDGTGTAVGFGGIEPIEIQAEMERSFLDYAMSVIVRGPARRP